MIYFIFHVDKMASLLKIFHEFLQMRRIIYLKNGFDGMLNAVKFGNDFEDEARQKYCEVYPERDVQQVGLVIKDKFSFFGASPDGIITFKGGSGTRGGYYGILEIKCIYSCRDKEKIEGCKFLNKKGQLLRGSRYYTQVQLCAWATGAKFIHFFLWTKHDYKLVPVPLDPEFA